MDGSLPAPTPLPPIATPGGLIPPSQGFPSAPRPQPAQTGGVVGRPSGDPEVQQQRIERSAEQRRVESVLPKQVDSKLQVFRADRSGRIPYGNTKPLAVILLKDLEAANAAGTPTDEVIEAKLGEKNVQNGKFICRFVDRAGKPMNALQFPPFDITIGDDEGDDNMGNDAADEEDDQVVSFQPTGGYPNPAPAPTGLDLTAIARMQDGVREQEAKRGSDMAVLIASMQGNMTAMMTAMQQQQQARDAAAREEARQRDEREAARRSQFHTTLLGIVPLVMPFIAKMFGPKEATQSPSDVLMLELVKAKFSEKPTDGTSTMEQLAKLMPEMMRSQLAIQAEGTKASMGVQSEVTGMLVKSLMGSMKDVLDSKKEVSEPKEDGTLATVLKALGPVLAGMAAQPQPPQVTYQQQQQPQAPQQIEQQAPPQADVQQVEQPVRRRKVQPPPAPPAQPPAGTAPAEKPRQDPTKFPDDSRIASCLDTVRKLSTGEIPANERFNALEWVGKWAPPSMITAVKSGSREQVMTVGQNAVMASPVLINWLSTEGMVEFLEGALADLKHLLDGTLTEPIAIASVRANVTFVHAQRTKNAGPPTGVVIKQAEVLPPSTPPASTPPSAPPAATIPPAPRRRRAPPADVPADPPALAAGAPPAADASSPTPPEPPAPTAGG